ncbi:alkaline phosphatase family protein [Roseivivax sp. GX 12232]|uniref:alkaline phosphatase D family protein n=1 Tax=Roseivivax sp. GX 12232 TaxID=2900547 RepID=UPI001E50BC28|nr:alkaline phosphatase D family protein [Roseivivax sp. GX 12232]MCE0505070.1 alkaline phosphatase family protein [Roseivivax sp. GX 12232]
MPVTAGPVLIFRALDDSVLRLAALVLTDSAESPPPELETEAGRVAPRLLAEIGGEGVWRFDFALPRGGRPSYSFDGVSHRVATDFDGDLRIGFVSCNGEEHGDLDRDEAERNAMWRHMREAHLQSPFHLILHGGDQVYADEVTRGHALSESWPEDLEEAPGAEALDDLEDHLRRGFLERYRLTYAGAGFARMAAEVPALMIWDDHDICDGWGSLGEELAAHPIARRLFRAAREAFLLYQQAATEDDVPALFLDPKGRSLSFRRDLPGVSVIAPDLRSERGMERIMGPAGWQGFETAAEAPEERVLLVSSVPLLGPRLSILERLMNAIPTMQKYEDDLRDQWQSRAHRAEWQRMLRRVLEIEAGGSDVTALSGEIHLATRATLDSPRGPVHQLVASGIAHRAPPKAWAWMLGTLARLGEAPLPEHPIRIAPLPGRGTNYTAERNYLMLEREGGVWSARWALEESGVTPALPI